jgi:hypothetical protein
MRRLAPIALLFAACAAPARPTVSPARAGRSAELTVGDLAASVVASGATGDVVLVALGPSSDTGHDGRFLVLDAAGALLARGEVSASAPPFVVRGTDGRSLDVVWPGARDVDALAALEARHGATRIRHHAASTYFTLPYAGVALAAEGGAPALVVLHRDPVSCFFAGSTTSASLAGEPDARSFTSPGGLAGELALAPLGEGLVAVFHPGEGEAASAWQRFDRALVPLGAPTPSDATGCRLAVALEARALLACDDVALVIGADGALVARIAYPVEGHALAAAAAGETALVAVRTREGVALVSLPDATQRDVLPEPLVGLALDLLPHVSIAATDARTFFVAWAAGDAPGPGRLRVRRYVLSP